jgi:hypothetical protein
MSARPPRPVSSSSLRLMTRAGLLDASNLWKHEVSFDAKSLFLCDEYEKPTQSALVALTI